MDIVAFLWAAFLPVPSCYHPGPSTGGTPHHCKDPTASCVCWKAFWRFSKSTSLANLSQALQSETVASNAVMEVRDLAPQGKGVCLNKSSGQKNSLELKLELANFLGCKLLDCNPASLIPQQPPKKTFYIWSESRYLLAQHVRLSAAIGWPCS